MRHYIDAISSPPILDEGIIDSIRQWIQGLNEPVKVRGQALTKGLEGQLVSKYGSEVPQQVKSSNKTWMWSRLTYQNLYKFATQVEHFTDIELDRALKNPIVTNNLKQLFQNAPNDKDGASRMALPLTSAIIKNNSNFISTIVDPQSKQYLSKAIAVAVLDGLAYIEQGKKDNTSPQDQAPDQAGKQSAVEPEATTQAGPEAELSTDDLRSAIQSIKQGLARIKGGA